MAVENSVNFDLVEPRYVSIDTKGLAGYVTRRDRINPVQHGKYHGCWCPHSMCRLDISNYGTEYVKQVSACLTWGRIPTIMSVWRNGIKCICMFIFSMYILEHKGISNVVRLSLSVSFVALQHKSLGCGSMHSLVTMLLLKLQGIFYGLYGHL